MCCRVASEPVVRLPQGVRARLAVLVSKAQRFRMATKILLGGIPSLNNDQSSSNPAHHPSRSPATPARAGIIVRSRPWVDGQFARIAPAISLPPQLHWSHGLGAKSYSSITPPANFSPTPCTVCIYQPFLPVFGGPWCPCHLALP